MVRVGVLSILLIAALFLIPVPVDAEPRGAWWSHMAFESLSWNEDRISPNVTYYGVAVVSTRCTMSPGSFVNQHGGSLDMVETITASISSDLDGLTTALSHDVFEIEYSLSDCLSSDSKTLVTSFTYTLEEIAPAYTLGMVKISYESSWTGELEMWFQVMVDAYGDMVVDAPEAVTLDSSGHAAVPITVTNDHNTAMVVQIDPLLRGLIGAQPIGILGTALEPGESALFHIDLRTDDAEATQGLLVLDTTWHPLDDASTPETSRTLIQVSTHDAHQTLTQGVEEAPATLPVLLVAAIGALWMRRLR